MREDEIECAAKGTAVSADGLSVVIAGSESRLSIDALRLQCFTHRV